MHLHPLAPLLLPLLFPLPSHTQTPLNFIPSTPNPLLLSFNTTLVSPQGSLLSEAAVTNPPTLLTTTLLPPHTYLAIMVDPTAGNPPSSIQVLHYILPGLTNLNTTSTSTLNGTTLYPLTSTSPPLAPYLVPAPPPGNVHSYTVTLFQQPTGFAVPSAFMSYLPLNESDLTNRYPFNLTGFVEAAGLGAPRAGGWFDLRNGTTGSATTTTTTTGQGTSGGGGTATGKSVKASSEASLVRTGGGGDVWSVGGFARALVAVVGVAAWV